MKSLDFTLLCISVWTPYSFEKAQRMYISQANVPSLLQWIWESFANLLAGKFAAVG